MKYLFPPQTKNKKQSKKKNPEIVKKSSQWKITTHTAVHLIFLGWPNCFDKKYIWIIGLFLVIDCHDFIRLLLYLVEEKTTISSNLYKAAQRTFLVHFP